VQDAGSNWQFDIFAFAEETPGNTLSLLAMHVFQQSSVLQHYKLSERHFWRWVQRIESGYVASNPYHNRQVSPAETGTCIAAVSNCIM